MYIAIKLPDERWLEISDDMIFVGRERFEAFDAFDWTGTTLSLRGKGNSHTVLQLPTKKTLIEVDAPFLEEFMEYTAYVMVKENRLIVDGMVIHCDGRNEFRIEDKGLEIRLGGEIYAEIESQLYAKVMDLFSRDDSYHSVEVKDGKIVKVGSYTTLFGPATETAKEAYVFYRGAWRQIKHAEVRSGRLYLISSDFLSIPTVVTVYKKKGVRAWPVKTVS